VFLFDEPLSNLDAKLRTQMRLEIKRLHRKVATTIIYVTHDQIEAMTLADRIVVMRDGYIEQMGNPIDVFQNPVNTFVAGFIGSPPMNLVPAQVVSTENGLALRFNERLQIAIPERRESSLAAGQQVVVGLRTEDLKLDNGNNHIPDDWKIEGVVDVVEPLGSETNMHMDLCGVKFVAKSDGRRKIRSGEKLLLALNLNHLHIFDAESTLSIY